MKKYDVFIFWNELDLLEMRLNILDAHVDYFVIVEATQTFTGLSKPLYFKENRERFTRFEKKIIHYVVDDMPQNADDLRTRLTQQDVSQVDRDVIQDTLTSPHTAPGQEHWLREYYQKASMKRPLAGRLADDDFCFVSDLDEIWNPDAHIDYTHDAVFKFRQLMYAYFLNNRSSEVWAGTCATQYKNIKHDSICRLDALPENNYSYIAHGGWHFTNMGGANQVRKKLESYGHQEFNNAKIKSNIEKNIKNNTDFIGRKFTFWTDEADLPLYLLEHRDMYAEYFKATSSPSKKTKKIVVSQLTGGLGNQFFQYAAGKARAEKLNADFALDISLYKHAKRPFVLDQFRITARKATWWDIVRTKYASYFFGFGHHFIEPHFHVAPEFFNATGNIYIEGLFQSEKYFKHIADSIQKEFTLRAPITETHPDIVERISTSQSVSIAIRRGDYIGKSHLYNILNQEYYAKAMAMISEKVTDPKFFFFSDDIGWVKEKIPHPANSVFVSDGILSGPEELSLMALCQHNIIANSTFSWWAAWLNKNPDKIVIAPKTWFTDTSKNTQDIIPDRWIRI